jgi:hypothetical protein
MLISAPSVELAQMFALLALLSRSKVISNHKKRPFGLFLLSFFDGSISREMFFVKKPGGSW